MEVSHGGMPILRTVMAMGLFAFGRMGCHFYQVMQSLCVMAIRRRLKVALVWWLACTEGAQSGST
jgi:hypothetical protein